MSIRRSTPIAALAATVALLTGCAGDPTPAETTPLFASDEEAFAAAEQTYRAYVDALNHVDLSDPDTFEPVLAWTVEGANAGARESFTTMRADGWTVVGQSKYDGFTGKAADFTPDSVAVDAVVCLDVTEVDVRDASGESVVPAARADRQPAELVFIEASTATGLAISSSSATGGDTCD